MASGVSGLTLKAECSGWMNKKKAGKGSWQKRFCNLENKGGGTFEFAYYSTEYLNDETRQGSLPVAGAKITPCTYPDGKKPVPLRLNVANATGFIFRQGGQEWFYHEITDRKEVKKRSKEKKVDVKLLNEDAAQKAEVKAKAAADKAADEEAKIEKELAEAQKQAAEEESQLAQKQELRNKKNWKAEAKRLEASRAAAKTAAAAAKKAAADAASAVYDAKEKAKAEAEKASAEAKKVYEAKLVDFKGNASVPRWLKIMESKGASLTIEND